MVRYFGLLHLLKLNIECVIFFYFLDALAHCFKQTTSSRFSMHHCEVCHKGFTGFMKQALRCVGKWGIFLLNIKFNKPSYLCITEIFAKAKIFRMRIKFLLTVYNTAID